MFYSTLAIAATAFTGLVSAQQNTSSTYTIDPNTVDYSTRQDWCLGQRNTCRSLCDMQAFPNNCDPNTLTYSCVCTDGSSPNISAYQQSLPAQVCRVYVDQCVVGSGSDIDEITACRDIQCGNRTVNQLDSSDSASSSMTATTSSSGSSSSSTSGSSSGSGSDSSDSSDSTSSSTASGASSSPTDSGALAMGVAQSYGAGILATGLLALFGLAL